MVRPKKNIYSTLTAVSSAAQLGFSTLYPAGQAFGCSDEQIFTPIAIRSGGWSPSPGLTIPWGSWDEQGPFGGGSVGPSSSELNPYYSNVLENFFKGLDFIHVVNDSNEALNIRKLDNPPYTVFTTGLRGPLLVSGWGYDICDRPVPTPDGESHETDMQGNRSTWKTGPVNLQWDAERSVWQGGAQIVCGIVQGAIHAPSTPCSPTSFTVRLMRLHGAGTTGTVAAKVSEGWWGGDEYEQITVKNRDPSLEEAANEGMIFCIAVRINYEWLPIWVGCPDPLTYAERGGKNFSCNIAP